jgi:2-polyprenyl-3-methyl-5-hydroxy-6-metoxy-1,4-benzoquinol methylase
MGCPHCREARHTMRYDFGAQRVVRCDGCGLLRLDPPPTEDDIRAVYDKDYFNNTEFMRGTTQSLFGYSDYIAERFNKQQQYATIAREIARRLDIVDRRPRLLEVGCGLGYFLDVAFEENFDVAGLEFNPHAVERLSQKYAFPVSTGALESAELPPGPFDSVVLLDVIEHLRDPFAGLDRIHAAIAPRGLLVLSTVDAESFMSRLLGKRLEDFRRTREHLFFFSRSTLRAILDAHGFEVETIRSIGHTFSVEMLLERLALYNRPVFTALRRLAKRLGVGNLQVYVNPGTKMIAYARRKG